MHYQAVNNPRVSGEERLSALKAAAAEKPGPVKTTGGINNHIHTSYSFSPYTPNMADLKAWDAGFEAAGSVDPRWGLFSSENPLAGESLVSGLAIYAAAGSALDLQHPEAATIQ